MPESLAVISNVGASAQCSAQRAPLHHPLVQTMPCPNTTLWRNNTGRCGCEHLEPIIHIMLKECCFCGGVVCTCIWAQAGGRGGICK